MNDWSRRLGCVLVSVCIVTSSVGCKPTVTRADQENLVLDTTHVPVERFLDALSKRLSTSWWGADENSPDADPSRIYRLDGSGVTVILTAMPHDRCNPNASWHTTWDKAYRLDFVYRTSSPTKRADARRKLFQAASDVGERLVPFVECPAWRVSAFHP